ncbi:hypothetical protein GCK32_020565, partial [Trichostrongylus colubriformis]
MHLSTLLLACCALWFAGGYAALLPDQQFLFKTIIPRDKVVGPTGYQDVLLKVINSFAPPGYKP